MRGRFTYCLLWVLGIGFFLLPSALASAASPQTVITSAPSNDSLQGQTTSTSASFTWSVSNLSSYTSSCSLGTFETSTFSPCTSPQVYSNVSLGDHTFRVMVSGVGGSSSVGWAWTVVSTLSPSVVFQPQAPQVIIEYRQVAKRGLERFSLTAGMLPRPNQSKIASYTWSLSSGKIVGYGRSLSYRLPYRVHQRIFLSAVNQRQLSGVASVNL